TVGVEVGGRPALARAVGFVLAVGVKGHERQPVRVAAGGVAALLGDQQHRLAAELVAGLKVGIGAVAARPAALGVHFVLGQQRLPELGCGVGREGRRAVLDADVGGFGVGGRRAL